MRKKMENKIVNALIIMFLYLELTKCLFLEWNRGKVELIVKVDLRTITFLGFFMRNFHHFDI